MRSPIDAFNAAVAEWRTDRGVGKTIEPANRWVDRVVRNAAALVIGYVSVATLAGIQALADAPWLVHKLTDPIGFAIGAAIAVRLRARTATIVLSGLAISQGAEFLMDLSAGAPAIHGREPHVALMIAGIAGIAVGRRLWKDPSDAASRQQAARDETTATSPDNASTLSSRRSHRDWRRMFAVLSPSVGDCHA